MSKSRIEWTDETWNVTGGCTPVSAGCLNCAAARSARRCIGFGNDKYKGLVDGAKWTGEVRLYPDELQKPLHWKRARMIFVDFMSDLFHPDVPFEFIDKVWAVMALCPDHTFQILTKRPERMAEYLNLKDGNVSIRPPYIEASARRWLEEKVLLMKYWKDFLWLDHNTPYTLPWPLPNVWLGTTAENQQMADERIPHLLKCPAAKRFVSVEPMLGAVDLEHIRLGEYYCPQCKEFFDTEKRWASPCCGADLEADAPEDGCTEKCSECKQDFDADRSIPECPNCNNQGGGRYIQPDYSACFSRDIEGLVLGDLDWIICGGESGPGARPMHPDWARSLRDQCKAAGVPFFFKQWGKFVYPHQMTPAEFMAWDVHHGTECVDERPIALGKKKAGSLLDGVHHKKYPG